VRVRAIALVGIVAGALSVCCNSILGEPVATVSPSDIWRDSAIALDNFRVSYEVDSGPVSKALAGLKDNPPDESLRPLMVQVASRYHSLIDVTRKGSQWKYQIRKDVSPLDLDSLAKGGGAFGPSSVASDDVETHSLNGLFYLDNVNHNGAFRSVWPDNPETPLSFVLMPSNMDLVSKLSGGEILVEARDKSGNSLLRYHLDSNYGMMPKEIEYFQVLSTGGLFLYKLVKIEKYLNTNRGAYIPETGVIYDHPSSESGSVTWLNESHFNLNKSEIGIDIPDSEFKLKFPAGTNVTDYTLDIDYIIPKDGKNPVFSITNSETN
jgi:hypothetical protein